MSSSKQICLILFSALLAVLPLSGQSPEVGSTAEKDKALDWSFTPDPSLPNVLILGDSISIGYTLYVRELLAGKANVYRPMKGKSDRPYNCGGTTKGVKGIKNWIKGKDWDLIHFNWGLHDMKHVKEAGTDDLSNDPNDPTQTSLSVYSKKLRYLTSEIKGTGARAVFATTTPVAPETIDPYRSPEDPMRYNQVALKVMQSEGVRVNDLYAHANSNLTEWQLPKNVHFNQTGSYALAEQVASVISEELGLGQLQVKAKPANSKSDNKGSAYLETEGEQKRDLVYKQVGKRQLMLDLYYPTKKLSKFAPVVIYTHGGGWAAGSRAGVTKGLFAPLFTQLLDEGFAVATVDYRLYNKSGKVAMRDCVIDSKDAVRYLAQNAAELGIAPRRFFVMGDSAGGQIAQMLLLSAPNSLIGDPELAGARYRILAGVSWYGPCDFQNMNLFNHDDRPDFKDRFGPRITPQPVSPEEKDALYKEMSPISYLKKRSAPLFMIQGDSDTTIPVKHAYYMKERADAIGAEVDILIVKNSGHNWRRSGGDIEPTKEVITQRTVEFFLEHLSQSAQ